MQRLLDSVGRTLKKAPIIVQVPVLLDDEGAELVKAAD